MSGLDLSAAIEAAARGMWDGTPGPLGFDRTWDEAHAPIKHDVLEAALLAVTAAAPLIEAQVREQVAAEIEAERDRHHPHAVLLNAARVAFTRAARIARGQS